MPAVATRKSDVRIGGFPKEIKAGTQHRVGLAPAGARERWQWATRRSSRPASAPHAGSWTRTTRTPARGRPTGQRRPSWRQDGGQGERAATAGVRDARRGQGLFTDSTRATRPGRALGESGARAIAYETVTAPDGSLPLLTPMSEVAGRLSIQAGAFALQKANGVVAASCSAACRAYSLPTFSLSGVVVYRVPTQPIWLSVLCENVTILDLVHCRACASLIDYLGWACAPTRSTQPSTQSMRAGSGGRPDHWRCPDRGCGGTEARVGAKRQRHCKG